MIRNLYYIIFNAVLFYLFIQFMGALNSFNPDLRAKRTIDDFIPSLIGGTLVINFICFVVCFLFAFRKVFVNKRTIINKILLFIAVELLLVFWYLYVINNIFLIS
ncbi:hypothetical protein [Neobacillus vireti]|uniref:hypothetical protein n=1 Tax=Neobacillus vireti TaxID=220686 RepID=UPI002FFE24F4